MSPDNDRVLVLAPHTDDGEFGCGGTISRFVQEGKEIFYAAFSTAEEGDLSSRNLGQEMDFWARYRFRDVLNLEAGYSITWAGDAMEELGRLEGTGNVAYFMSSFRF